MGKRSRNNNERLSVGEIVRIESEFGMLPCGIYRVDGVAGDMIMLSAGEIRAGVPMSFIKLTARHLSEPACWKGREIEILESNACECEECRSLLIQKRASISPGISGETIVQ